MANKKTTDLRFKICGFLLYISYLKRNYPKTSFTFLPISAGESTT